MSNAPHPTDPAVMNGVIPYLLMVGRAAEACDFYARAFGAKGLGRMPFPDGKPGLIHAQIEINGEVRATGTLSVVDYGGGTREISLASRASGVELSPCGMSVVGFYNRLLTPEEKAAFKLSSGL